MTEELAHCAQTHMKDEHYKSNAISPLKDSITTSYMEEHSEIKLLFADEMHIIPKTIITRCASEYKRTCIFPKRRLII